MGTSSNGEPRVSMLMPVYQAESYLEETVESILVQGFDDFELLALDDGSTDDEIESRLIQGDGGALIHASGMYRAHALRSIEGYRQEFEYGEVIDLDLRLAECGRLANLPQRLYEYRKNFASVCFTRGLEIRRKHDGAIREALIRRGLDPQSAPERAPDTPQSSHDPIWAICTNRALAMVP